MTALLALVRFEFVRRLRWRPLIWLVLAHPVLVGVAYAVPSSPPLGTDLAFMGMQVVWLILVSFELGRDRELGMDALMTSNLASPREYVLGKILALGGLLGVYQAAVAVVVAAFAPGGVAEAWSTVGAISLLVALIPLALLTELLVATRFPLFYVVPLGTGVLLVSFWSGLDAMTIAAWLGLESDSILSIRPTIAGVAGLIALFPLAARRVAAERPL